MTVCSKADARLGRRVWDTADQERVIEARWLTALQRRDCPLTRRVSGGETSRLATVGLRPMRRVKGDGLEEWEFIYHVSQGTVGLLKNDFSRAFMQLAPKKVSMS